MNCLLCYNSPVVSAGEQLFFPLQYPILLPRKNIFKALRMFITASEQTLWSLFAAFGDWEVF